MQHVIPDSAAETYAPAKSFEFWWHSSLILGLVLLVYWPSLFNGFNLDDPELLVNNPAVHGLAPAHLRAIFTSVANGLEYLPVRDLTYGLDYVFWGLNPFGYHLSNLVYYGLACVVLYLLLFRIARRWTPRAHPVAFLATLLFAVHPVHVESVAGIAQRKDLVSGLFCFLGLLFFVEFREKGRGAGYAAALFCFVLALFAKATVVIVPLLIVLLDALIGGRQEGFSKRLFRALPFLVVSAVYTAVTARILADAGIVRTGAYAVGPHLATALKAVFYYLKVLILPYPLYYYHPFAASPSFGSSPVLLAALGLLLLCLAAARSRDRWPVVWFSVAWCLITFLPVVGLIPTSTVVADRYLFLPSAGFCLLVAWPAVAPVVHRAGRKTVVAATAGLLLVALAFGVITNKRLADWYDSLTLVEANLRDFPVEDPRLHVTLAKEYFERGRFDRAFEHLERARRINPEFSTDENIFRALYALEHGEPDQALARLEEISIPGKFEIHDINFLYGLVYENRGDIARAVTYYEAALQSPRRLDDVTSRSGDLQAYIRNLEN